MKEHDWQRLEAIFEAAEKEATFNGRMRVLDQWCGDDTDLREQAEKLLRADLEAAEFLDGAAPIPETSAPYRRLTAGEFLGPYRIVRQIGEGGMGTVFLAERSDGSFDLQVAIKVLRHGTEGKAAIERFEHERRILASLSHPGIARLLDGGTTDSGLPYVVMEYVTGEPIDLACDRRELSSAARIELMLTVCEAVTAAHRKLVVHRDLKPSNILITEAGEPKLLDFGIAKLLNPEGFDSSTRATASFDRRLTPSYASPEQLRGGMITVATDIYLLGVTLYQLLTRHTPFNFTSSSLLEIERTVTTEVPQRPSERAAGLDADLDAIVLKALRSEPSLRYGSVEALGEDLKRYRDGLPVRAREGSFRYAAGKALRRHRLALTVGLLFVFLLGAFAVSTAMQVQRTERSLRRMGAVHGFLLELFSHADPEFAKGQEVTVAEVLSRAERQLALGGAGEPDTQRLLHAIFGRVALHSGQLASAQEHLEQALLVGDDNDSPPGLSHSRTLGDLALTLLYRGDEQAEMKALEALDIARKTPGTTALDQLELLNTAATIYCWQRAWEQARPLVSEARSLVDMSQPNQATAMALSLNALLAKNHDQDVASSRRDYLASLEMYRALEGDIYPEIANIQNQLGLLEEDEGRLQEALGWHSQALEVRQALYPQGNWEVAQSFFQISTLQWRIGDLAAAEISMGEAWSLYDRDANLGPSYSRTLFLWIQLAEIRLALGRSQEAEEMLEELTVEWWESRKPTSQLLSLARRALGCLRIAQGQPVAAESLLTKSLEVLKQRHGEGAWEIQVARECLDRTGIRSSRDIDQ